MIGVIGNGAVLLFNTILLLWFVDGDNYEFVPLIIVLMVINLCMIFWSFVMGKI